MIPERGSSFGESIPEARRLLEVWDRLGRAHMMIGAGCSCGIGGIVVALEDFEQDIADYLQAEAERLKRPDVLQYLNEQAREGELWSISKLLAGLTQPTESGFYEPGANTFLLERLARTLQSFEKLHGST
jgi:nucleoid-associated protein YejK